MPSVQGGPNPNGVDDLDAETIKPPSFERVMAWAGLAIKKNIMVPLSGESVVRLTDVFLKYSRLDAGQSTEQVHHTGEAPDYTRLEEPELAQLQALLAKATPPR